MCHAFNILYVQEICWKYFPLLISALGSAEHKIWPNVVFSYQVFLFLQRTNCSYIHLDSYLDSDRLNNDNHKQRLRHYDTKLSKRTENYTVEKAIHILETLNHWNAKCWKRGYCTGIFLLLYVTFKLKSGKTNLQTPICQFSIILHS